MVRNPATEQPNNVFFNLEIGGLRRIYIQPNVPMDMSIIMEPKQGRFSCTLLDDTGFNVEPHIWAGEGRGGVPKGTIQWGYEGTLNKKSPRIPCEIVNYSPTVGRNYFQLDIEGLFTHSEATHQSGGFWGTLSSVIKDYSERYDLALDLSDGLGAASLLGISQDKTTELKEKEFYKQATESDSAFASRVIERFGVSRASGKAGYWMMTTVDNDPQTGRPGAVLKIVNPESAPVEYSWRVQDKDSTVIEWSPDISFMPHAAIGGDSMVAFSHEDLTGHEMAIAFNPGTMDAMSPNVEPGGYQSRVTPIDGREPNQAIYIGEENMPPEVGDSAVKVIAQPAREPSMSLMDGVNKYLAGRSFIYQGVLTILGDPTVSPGRLCRVIFRYPSSIMNPRISNGSLHHTSGKYFIESVTHTLSAGLYTTTLNLRREAQLVRPAVAT